MPNSTPRPDPATAAKAAPHSITLVPGNWQFQARPDQTLAQAAAGAGVELPLSCQNGTCRTCLCRVVQGQVRYLIEWPGLSADEKQEGWTLPCVALPLSDLVIDAPHALRPG